MIAVENIVLMLIFKFVTNVIFVCNIFYIQVVGEYIMSSRESEQSPLHTASCRLLLDVLPGLETSVVFQETVNKVCQILSIYIHTDILQSF